LKNRAILTRPQGRVKLYLKALAFANPGKLRYFARWLESFKPRGKEA
jgi:hypothetical protein